MFALLQAQPEAASMERECETRIPQRVGCVCGKQHSLAGHGKLSGRAEPRPPRAAGAWSRASSTAPPSGATAIFARTARDDDPLTDSRNNAIDRERDLLRWHHRYSRDGLSFTGVLEYESDEYMRRDFFEDLYREDVQADSYLELSKNWKTTTSACWPARG